MLRVLKRRMTMTSCFKGKFKVTSPRGYRTLNGVKEYHGGLDVVALGSDKDIYAIADGTVDATPYEKNGFGYYVRQLLPDGRRVYYGHMKKDSICVKSGQSIKKGQKIGVMGSTGNSTGEHCHIELRVKGTSKESLDISAFTGIPNKCGTYEANGSTLSDDLDVLVKNGVINSPDYWLNNVGKVKYLDELLHNVAQKLR